MARHRNFITSVASLINMLHAQFQLSKQEWEESSHSRHTWWNLLERRRLQFHRVMHKKCVGSLKEEDLKGKRVFLRVDLNVPLNDKNYNDIPDDTKLRAVVPTIEYLMQRGSRVILASHRGSPIGITPKYSLKPLAPKLSKLLGVEVKTANDCIGHQVAYMVREIPEGGVLLLENLRFHTEERFLDDEFANKMASPADLYVNDDFGSAHRSSPSIQRVPDRLKPKPTVAGFLMKTELPNLTEVVKNPLMPFASSVGGSKLSTKFGVIENLLENYKVNLLLLGGGLIFTFYEAQGYSVGSSLVEDVMLDPAKSLIEKAKENGISLILPGDVVIADKFSAGANCPVSKIPHNWMGLDIGPDAIASFSAALDTSKTIIWYGPMGVFEYDKFAAGTEFIAKKLAELGGNGVTTIITGGESVTAVEKVGLADKMSHVSMGGFASKELLEGIPLSGVLALDDDDA